MHAVLSTHQLSSRSFRNFLVPAQCLARLARKSEPFGLWGKGGPVREDNFLMVGKRKADGDVPPQGESSSKKCLHRVDVGSSKPDSVPYSMAMRKPLSPDQAAINLMSYNVNGLRALIKTTQLCDLVRDYDADVLFLQETKLQEVNVDEQMRGLCGPDYESVWACSTTKKGYAGTAVFFRKSLGIDTNSVHLGFRDGASEDYDAEGRILTIEHDDFYIVGAYVPNSGQKLERLEARINSWEERLAKYLNVLESRGKAIIYAGDLNVAHCPIDLWGNHKQNSKSAGYTAEERERMTKLLSTSNYVDTFRDVHGPHIAGFTYFSHRHNAKELGRGWRLDYFIISSRLREFVHDSYIVTDFGTSDHQPIGLTLLKRTGNE